MDRRTRSRTTKTPKKTGDRQKPQELKSKPKPDQLPPPQALDVERAVAKPADDPLSAAKWAILGGRCDCVRLLKAAAVAARGIGTSIVEAQEMAPADDQDRWYRHELGMSTEEAARFVRFAKTCPIPLPDLSPAVELRPKGLARLLSSLAGALSADCAVDEPETTVVPGKTAPRPIAPPKNEPDPEKGSGGGADRSADCSDTPLTPLQRAVVAAEAAIANGQDECPPPPGVNYFFFRQIWQLQKSRPDLVARIKTGELDIGQARQLVGSTVSTAEV